MALLDLAFIKVFSKSQFQTDVGAITMLYMLLLIFLIKSNPPDFELQRYHTNVCYLWFEWRCQSMGCRSIIQYATTSVTGGGIRIHTLYKNVSLLLRKSLLNTNSFIKYFFYLVIVVIAY